MLCFWGGFPFDIFTLYSEQYYAYGPRVPELNLENCVSDDPGGTSGHVVQVKAIALLRSIYTTHTYMGTIRCFFDASLDYFLPLTMQRCVAMGLAESFGHLFMVRKRWHG